MLGLDSYVLRARLRPGLLVLLPATVTVLALNPDGIIGWSGIVAVVIQAGGAFLVGQYVGDIGKAHEPELYHEWGGRPTELMLCHAHAPNAATRELRHRKLETLVPGLRMPTADEEAENFEAACQTYTAAVEQLRPKVRALPLVFAENTHYGFRRNAWALRRWGIGVAAIGVLILGLDLLARVSEHRRVEPLLGLALVLNVALLAFWIWAVSASWVKRSALTVREPLS